MAAQEKLFSVEAFDDFIYLPENANRRLEYIRGEVVEVVSNNYSSLIAARILARLLVYVEQHNLGYVTGADGGYVVAGERYIPDVAFVSRQRQPHPSRAAYNPIAPDLAVEVLSPTDDPSDLRVKVVNYLLAETTVWVINPDRQQVEIYAPRQSPKTLGAADLFDGGAVLPGFTLLMQDIFPPEPPA